jgi:REP-associated tyrosine transposase
MPRTFAQGAPVCPEGAGLGRGRSTLRPYSKLVRHPGLRFCGPGLLVVCWLNVNPSSEAEAPRRRSIRLAGFDYTRNGRYFITVCAAGQRCLFAAVHHGTVQLSPLGQLISREWQATIALRPYLESNASVVMPNHFHAVFTLTREGILRRGVACYALHPAARTPPEGHSVGAIVRAFKSAVTRAARIELSHAGHVWQRNYYERAIRNDEEYLRTCRYIRSNPEEWEFDSENRGRRKDAGSRW